MKCSQCAIEFEGKFCPECGTRAEAVPPIVYPAVSPQQQPDYQTVPVQPGEKKEKKPFFLRWWFILLVIIAVICGIGKYSSMIKWKDIELMGVIPVPPSGSGKVYENSDEEFNAKLKNVSDAQYNSYLQKCIEKGFVMDADKSSGSYKAYNESGYSLDMSHIGEKLSITVKAPMQMGTIRWPSGTAGSLLPTPKSTTGKFSFEYDDSFCVYVGDTPKADYDDYVAQCVQAGFDVDYDKGDNYYYAYNADGWDLTLKYEGNSTMLVRIDEPYEIETEETESTESTESGESTESETEPTEETESMYPEEETETEQTVETAEAVSASGLDPDFKAAMDAYEAFYVEYCEFMSDYSENPDDLTLIIKYGVMLDKMVEMDEAFYEWDEADMNDEELKYYFDVNNRVMKMLVDAGEW